MKLTIATSITQVKSSVAHSKRKKVPRKGMWKLGLKSCPKAVTSVKNSSPKPVMTNQWPAPTHDHCSIRVWPNVSRTSVTMRAGS